MRKNLIARLAVIGLAAFLSTACGPGDDEGDLAPDCVTTVTETVSAATTWGEDCREYSVPGYLYVEADLSIRAGTKVVFSADAGLEVSPDGSLSAVGTEKRPVVFQGADDSKGYWAGIAFISNSSKNELTWARVSDAGKKDGGHKFRTYSIHVTGRAKITNTIVENAAHDALVVGKEANIGGYADNAFRGVDGFPVTLYSTNVGQLDGASTYASGNEAPNGKPFIKVDAETAENAQTWRAQDVPYQVAGMHWIADADAVVTIEAGARLHFEEGAGFDIEDGALVVAGTDKHPVVFRGVDESKGYWAGIAFRSNSSKNELTWARVSDAGQESGGQAFRTYSVLVTGSGRVKITDTLIGNTRENALVVDDGANIAGFAKNRFEGIDGYPIELGANSVGDLDGEGSDYAGTTEAPNAKPWVFVRPEGVTKSQTWRKQNVPYRVGGKEGVVSIDDANAKVTVEAGARFEFDEGARLDVEQGTFVAEGTQQAPIVFTGVDQSKGYWAGLTFQSNAANSLDYVEVSYAGASGYHSSSQGIRVAGRLSLTNSIVKENAGKGVNVVSGGNFTESDNTFQNNGPNNSADDDIEDGNP